MARGSTAAVHVRDLRGFDQRKLTVERSTKGAWRVERRSREDAQGLHGHRPWLQPVDQHAADSPAAAGVGAIGDDPGGVGPVPDLEVVKAAQTYTRLDEFTYRYASRDFTAELTVDEDGLVAAYAEWQRTAWRSGRRARIPRQPIAEKMGHRVLLALVVGGLVAGLWGLARAVPRRRSDRHAGEQPERSPGGAGRRGARRDRSGRRVGRAGGRCRPG